MAQCIAQLARVACFGAWGTSLCVSVIAGHWVMFFLALLIPPIGLAHGVGT